MEFAYNDGGRSKYFRASDVGDCVTRAICNATGKDYKEVYDRLKVLVKKESVKTHRNHKRSSVRDGVFKETWKKYLEEIGWELVITAKIGQKEKVHLNEKELPTDKIMIVQVSRHLTCVKNGVLYDTYDCTRGGERMVYGYWVQGKPKTEPEIKKLGIRDRIKEIAESNPRDAFLFQPNYVRKVLGALIDAVEELENNKK